MSYLAIIRGSEAPVCADATLAQSLFDGAFAGFGGVARFLKPRKTDFVVGGTGGQTVLPNGAVLGVLLGVAQYDYCTWYAHSYQPGQEPQRPDLLWIRRDPNWFPNALPQQFRQKVMKNGRLMWDFRTARRTVWALCGSNGQGFEIDLENPVIFDMTSMSMFGKSDLKTHSYKWTGLRQFCMSLSQNGYAISPSMFVTQINLDPEAPSGVVMFKPVDNNGRIAWLDAESLARVADAAQSDLVQSLLQVTEILGGTDAPAAAAVETTQTAPQPRPAPAAQAVTPPAQPPAAPQNAASPQMSVLERARRFLDEPQQSAQTAASPRPAAAPQTPRSDGGVKNDLLDMLGTLGE